MTPRIPFLTLVAGLAVSAAVAVATPALADPDRHGDFDGRRHGPELNHALTRVTAMGGGSNWFVARQDAVHAWRDKVASRFGSEFSNWWSARAKDVSCRKIADDDPSWDNYGKRSMRSERHQELMITQCVVSAVPSKGWGSFWTGR